MKKKYLGFFIVIGFFILTFIYHIYFFSNKIITFGDFPYHYQPLLSSWFKTLSFIWGTVHLSESYLPIINFYGFAFFAGLFAHFNIDYAISSRILFFLPYIIFSYFFLLLLLRKIIGNNPIIVFGPFFFLLNPYMLIIAGWPNMAVASSFIPFALWSTIKFFENNALRWVLVIGLSLFIILIYEVRVAFICGLIISFYFFYRLLLEFNNKNLFKIFGGLLFANLLVITLAAFIVLPYYFSENLSTITAITSEKLFGTDFYNISYALTLFNAYWNGEKVTVFTGQPIIFYYWFYPLFAFSALLFIRRNKNILFFVLLALFGVFMTKGASAPFADVNAWLFYNVPFFNFFREPLQWSIIVAFAYSILIVTSLKYIYEFIDEKIDVSRIFFVKYIKFFLKIIIVIPIVLLLYSPARSVFTGKMERQSTTRTIPSDQAALRNFMSKDPFYYRTLSIPETQRFMYTDNLHPGFGVPYLSSVLERSVDQTALNFLNIRYITIPSDPIDNVYKYFAPQDAFERYLSNQSHLKYVVDFKGTKVWENINYLPHIYPVDELTYIEGNVMVHKIVEQDVPQRPAYYFKEQIPQLAKNNVINQINERNSEIFNHSTQILAVADCIRCDLNKKYYDYVSFPFARFLPNSPLYPLIHKKEEKSLLQLSSNEELLKLLAFFGEKRIVEIQEMLDKKIHNQYIINTINEYFTTIDKIEKLARATQPNIYKNEVMLNAKDYLLLSKRMILDTIDNPKLKIAGEVNDLLKNIVYRLNYTLDILDRKVVATEGDNKKLVVTVPQEGTYDLLIRRDEDGGITNTSEVTFNGIRKNFLGNDGEWITYGNINVNKDSYFVQVNAKPTNLIATNSSQITLSSDKNVSIQTLPVKIMTDPSTKYQISFDYRIISGEGSRVFISTNSDLVLKNGLVNYIYDTTIKRNFDSEWNKMESVLSPRFLYGVTDAKINFWLSRKNGQDSQVEIRNLKLIKIADPVVVLKKNNNKKLSKPQLSYQEINPTSYRVAIENADNPFFLAFSEGFDKGWKIYLEENTNKNVSDENIVARYFNNTVKEEKYKDTADLNTIIGTFVKKPVFENTHVQINNFGNGWLINKKGSYTINLVYEPQRYFIIGLLITGVSLISIILGIIFFVTKEFKKRKKQ